ncbi:MAG TPA: hypothetical protein VLH56_12060 [Dissulfurispiraceae bacterium]|nr:hypothetical protein [Dissulfurispiraceae bacterium]
MTQIIAAITHDFALMATDRRLTFLNGRDARKVADDDTCKLVNLCNISGIAYTGLARISGMPTHEWIAIRLAEHSCGSPAHAASILVESATREISTTFYRGQQTFVMAGWDLPPGEKHLRAHLRIISNIYNSKGERLPNPSKGYIQFVNWLSDNRKWAAKVAGYDLKDNQVRHLRRLFGRLADRKISSRTVLAALAQGVIDTASVAQGVGSKVLCMCIPRGAAESAASGRGSQLLATADEVACASFSYFDPAYSELRQYGPTVVCRGMACTTETENDPSRNYQSSQVKFLYMPKNNT